MFENLLRRDFGRKLPFLIGIASLKGRGHSTRVEVFVEDIAEVIDQGGVELRSAASVQFLADVFNSVWLFVRSACVLCVVGIGQSNNADSERSLIGLQTVGVAAAVPAFMIMRDGRQQIIDQFQRRQQIARDRWMLL